MNRRLAAVHHISWCKCQDVALLASVAFFLLANQYCLVAERSICHCAYDHVIPIYAVRREMNALVGMG